MQANFERRLHSAGLKSQEVRWTRTKIGKKFKTKNTKNNLRIKSDTSISGSDETSDSKNESIFPTLKSKPFGKQKKNLGKRIIPLKNNDETNSGRKNSQNIPDEIFKRAFTQQIQEQKDDAELDKMETVAKEKAKPVQVKKKKYKSKLISFIKQRNKLQTRNEIESWEKYLEDERILFLQRLQHKSQHILNENSIKLDDFDFVKVIGIGAYGDVLMAMNNETEYFYAIKILNKEMLIKKNQVLHAKSEKNILSAIRFTYAINLENFFQTETNLFFVMPLILGRDLYHYLDEVKILKEKAAKFYASQILLTIEFIHNLGLVYRDLKPENLVLDEFGYLKLIDFGLCKILKGRTYTICGTPEYMAPELLNNNGYGITIDWWAFSVLIFELCAGFTPFFSTTSDRIFQKILAGNYKCPAYFTSELRDLLYRMLTLDITKRLSSIQNGINVIKSHPWFVDVNWLAVLNRYVQPPYMPSLSHVGHLVKINFTEDKPLEDLAEHEKIFQNF